MIFDEFENYEHISFLYLFLSFILILRFLREYFDIQNWKIRFNKYKKGITFPWDYLTENHTQKNRYIMLKDNNRGSEFRILLLKNFFCMLKSFPFAWIVGRILVL